MTSFWAVWLLLAASGDGRGPADITKDADARLVARVKAAAAKGIMPDKIEAAVRTRATLNTFREEDRGPFRRADIAPDPDGGPGLPDAKTIRWAAYWVRPVEARNPRIVGIVWPKEGRPRVFFGKALPPR